MQLINVLSPIEISKYFELDTNIVDYSIHNIVNMALQPIQVVRQCNTGICHKDPSFDHLDIVILILPFLLYMMSPP